MRAAPPTLPRVLAALAAGALALLLARPLFERLRPLLATTDPPPLRVVPGEPEDADVLAWQDAFEARFPPTPLRPFPESTLARAVLPEPIAVRLYPVLRTPEVQWDALLAFRRVPGVERAFPLAEHPAGAWTLRTNAAGLRMDREPRLAPEGLVVGVAGDSHTEGVCDNADAWPALLEQRLAAAHALPPPGGVEVVNTASGGYSLYQHLGALELLLDGVPEGVLPEGATPAVPRRDPQAPERLDAFVACVYGGNDFMELLTLAHYLDRTRRPERWGRDNERLAPFRKTHLPAIAQAVEAVVYFRNNPTEVEYALARALEVAEDMLRHADARGLRLVFVLLPSALEAEPDLHADLLGPLLAGLAVSAEDLAIVPHIEDRYLAALADRGAEVLDMRPRLAEHPGPHYWSHDLHLNLVGQRLVSESVAERLEGLLR